jgi:hypothetical protein
MAQFTPLRTQYLFDLSGVMCKSRGQLLTMRQQWDTFERVENYNDVIYQYLRIGVRNKSYYQFTTRGELTDYRNGQELHILRYPFLDCSTFDPISNRAVPDVTPITPPPFVTQPPKVCSPVSTAIVASEYQQQQSDLAIYMHVSTYNSAHCYKYLFPSNDEKIAYHRAERLVLMG